MPHVIIECPSPYASDALSQALVDSAHDAMMASGLFAAKDIKTRFYCPEVVRVGSGEDAFFVHVTVSLIEGRSLEDRHALSEAMAKALRLVVPDVPQLSVEIRELVRAVYTKSQI